jgi:hypothetical protein
MKATLSPRKWRGMGAVPQAKAEDAALVEATVQRPDRWLRFLAFRLSWDGYGYAGF